MHCALESGWVCPFGAMAVGAASVTWVEAVRRPATLSFLGCLGHMHLLPPFPGATVAPNVLAAVKA